MQRTIEDSCRASRVISAKPGGSFGPVARALALADAPIIKSLQLSEKGFG
jgi:hypothetical protein